MFQALALTIVLSSFAAAATPADRDVVRVNGVSIRQSEIFERLWKRYGPQTLEEMVDELLLRQEAAARKITAPDAEIEKRFARLQAQFGSRELLISQLEQAGTTVARVKEDIADEVMRERLISSAQGIKVTDAELKAAFDSNKEKLGKPESAHLRHILVKTEAEAKDIVARVKAGADFTALARQQSLAASGKAAGGDYGFVARGMLPPEIDEAAFALKKGEIRIIPGPRGQHILQLLDRRPATPAVFNDMKEELREMLVADKIKDAAPAFLQELRRKADIKTATAPSPSRR